MDIIRFAISNPVKVSVGVLLLLLFGLLALLTIPIQLTPNVDQPKLTVETSWIGRSPVEIETEILQEQEDKLKSVTNLRKMTATANTGIGSIEMEFYVGTDMSRIRQEVSDKLREVPEYPDDVDEPRNRRVEITIRCTGRPSTRGKRAGDSGKDCSTHRTRTLPSEDGLLGCGDHRPGGRDRAASPPLPGIGGPQDL